VYVGRTKVNLDVANALNNLWKLWVTLWNYITTICWCLLYPL
jgi:hypothetical protein